MARQRPSLIGAIDLDTLPAEPAHTAAVVELPAPQAKPKPDVHHTSIYVPKAAYRRLKEIGLVEDKKVHDLIMEGIDKVIEARGHSERASRKQAS